MRTRNWSIRAKIVSLLLVPLLALVVMWALATVVTLGPSLDVIEARHRSDALSPPIDALVTQVELERKLTLAYLAGGRKNSSELLAARTQTNAAADTLRARAAEQLPAEATATAGGGMTGVAVTSQRMARLFAYVDALGELRGSVDRGEVDRSMALRRYSDVCDAGLLVFASLVWTPDAGLASQARALHTIGRAREALAQEDAVLGAAFVAGGFSTSDLAQAVQLIGAQRFLTGTALPELYPADRAEYERLATTPDFTTLASLENRVLADGTAGAPVPIDGAAWHTTYDKVRAELRTYEQRSTAALADRGGSGATVTFAQLVGAGLLGLVAVVVTMVASVRMGRNLIKRLAGLRQAALELAVDRLPRVVARLRRGEQVDVLNEAPALPYGNDEIGQVGHAFNELQRTAINSAVEEAAVRRGINDVFLNIARRSQTLLHRQLSILDRMERRTEDPTELEDLFRVDHLATRMRRHAEDLVILAGSAPGRGWRNPVPIIDVLRGAASEVEDYARVSIRPLPEGSVAGRAVGDVIHLMAELLENATSFSPPHTRVNVSGERVTHGLAIEIEDRGLGMSPEALAECNQRLTHPPEFNPATSAQLGMFVVARLAARHGIAVQLRPSPYGGVTAVALLPDDLVIVAPGDLSRTGMSGALRGPVAALGPAPSSRSAPTPLLSDAGDANGSGRSTLFREIITGQGPAITATAPGASLPEASLPEASPPEASPPGATLPGAATTSPPGATPSYPGSPPITGFPPGTESPPSPATPAAPPPAPSGKGTASKSTAAGRSAASKAAAASKPPAASKTPAVSKAASASKAPSAGKATPPGKATGRQRQVPQPRHARAEIIEATEPGGDGLPRRIRQTSLAPQLRVDPDLRLDPQSGGDDLWSGESWAGRTTSWPGESTSTAGGGATLGSTPPRSPEEVRAMMTSFQHGMERGRRDADGLDPHDGTP